MTSMLTTKKTLVLNQKWTPIRTISLQEALTKLVGTYRNGVPKARVVVTEGDLKFQTLNWEDWALMAPEGEEFIRAAKGKVFRIPEIIILNSPYDKLPQPKKTFSRRMLYKRDKNQCQYCGCQPGTELLTIDHVLPRAQGGTTTWENCVLACVECNSKKANRTPSVAGMKLKKIPAVPTYATLKQETYRMDSWEAYLGACYWSLPLVD